MFKQQSHGNGTKTTEGKRWQLQPETNRSPFLAHLRARIPRKQRETTKFTRSVFAPRKPAGLSHESPQNLRRRTAL